MENKAKIPVIIDTDPGVDDVLAILLALASPELEILAIIVTFGNTDVQSAYTNIFKIYQAVSRHLELYPEDNARFPNFAPANKPIFAVGPDGPLEGGTHYAHYFHGRDGLGNITERHPDLNISGTDSAFESNFVVSTKSSVEVTLELLRSRPGQISYIALGPLTNLASTLRADPETVRNGIGRVICMGGAIDVPGNTTPVAEFNFFADPFAVKELLTPPEPELGLPLERFVLLPLDITTSHELPFTLYKDKIDPDFDSTLRPSDASAKSPICHFTSSFLERTREVLLAYNMDAMELHDIVAVWCAIENPPVTSAKTSLPTMASGWEVTGRNFDIERYGDVTRGMLVVDRRAGANAQDFPPMENRAHSFETSVPPSPSVTEAPVDEDEDEDTDIGILLGDRGSSECVVGASAPEGRRSVACVVTTPGPETLLQILLKRVWAVSESSAS
ncbi:nucleoside hydrolase [Hygrophoropsis aurantiaca]|uniref:Nucleoside hydrolase n=1 Tax=Hygrophoropsis aurantiaca TaxID=72124 RepID=A0ACB8A913_9AGAM|nr:nucleoside hydrolase [Hygrophoropsis aurantiaca]